jgi:hypothetical protein
MPERLMTISAGRALRFDWVPGGDKPEWTAEDAAMACQGLDRRRYAAFAYRWAGDRLLYSTLYGCLMNEAAALAEREGWPTRTKCGKRYLEQLVKLALFEEHHWIVGHARIWPAVIEVSQQLWDQELSRRYEGVRMILESWCTDAHSHAMRWIREPEES